MLVCEPSCASALNDDLPDLLDDTELGGRLQQGVRLIDTFVAAAIAEQGISAHPARKQEVLLHGHCHQKSYYGTAGLKAALTSLTGARIAEIPSGCCGMAGSFGYEREHYELSLKIGEEALFPAIRAAAPDTPIVACGFSCRHQIEHFTGRKAVYWVELLNRKNLKFEM